MKQLFNKISKQSKIQDIIFASLGSVLIVTNQLHNYISNIILTGPQTVNSDEFIKFLSDLSSFDIQITAIALVLSAIMMAFIGWLLVSLIYQIFNIFLNYLKK